MSLLEICFLGGVGEYGRSCFLVKTKEVTLLVDCGVMRLKGQKGKYPLITKEIAESIDYVFLTHSHEDHSAALPYLYALGFRGDVIASKPTIDQCYKTFKQWRKREEQHEEGLPYQVADEERVSFLPLNSLEKMKWHTMDFGFSFMWGRSGHILGSVWFAFKIEGKQLFFSGDFHWESECYVYDIPPLQHVDLALVDNAYGSNTTTQGSYRQQMIQQIETTISEGGNLLLPVPTYGRSQEIIYMLMKGLSQSLINKYQFVVHEDILQGFLYFEHYQEWIYKDVFTFVNKMQSSLKSFRTFNSRSIIPDQTNIFLSPDPNLTTLISQTIYQHLKNNPVNHLILTGHIKKNSPADTLLKEQLDPIQISQIKTKVHPGFHEVRQLISILKPKRVVLTHNFKAQTDEVRIILKQETKHSVYSFEPGEHLVINE